MFKTFIVGIAVAVGMFIAGCAGSTTSPGESPTPTILPSIPVAHADAAIDDAINSYSGIPGLVDYLNLARDNGLFSYGYGAEAVHLGAQFAIAYCQMTPEQQADENSQAADIDPGLAAILVPALHDFCAN